MPLEKLPLDITAHMCKFLTGFDALELSHVNNSWRNYFSDGSFWRERVGGVKKGPRWSWKEQYAKTRSMLFHRPNIIDASFVYFVDNKNRICRPHFMLELYGLKSFSFDVWFSLLPATKDQHFGGILLGMQSTSRESRRWPNNHQQLALVSSKGELYCSLLSDKQAVADNLKANRWYHLVLTYENANKQQKVYLDGKEISSLVGPRHEWYSLTYVQVGTGCITSDTLECPYQGYIGWYGLYGVMDSFRAWRGKLSQEDVSVLATGGEISTIPLSGRVTRDQIACAKCTRPTEVTMQLLKNNN